MSIEWIEHKGKRILYIKYSGLSPEDMCAQVPRATQTIVDTGRDDILSLSDLTDCFVSKEFLELSKQQSAISMPRTRKAAVLGITGLKRLLLKTFNAVTPKPRVPFDTIDAAKDWLAE